MKKKVIDGLEIYSPELDSHFDTSTESPRETLGAGVALLFTVFVLCALGIILL